MNRTWGRWVLICAITAVLVWAGDWAHTALAASLLQGFDHDRTLFPLTGRHQRLECDECHHGGRYESLPTVCGSCHRAPPTHVIDQRAAASMGGCRACHNTTTWNSARFVHTPAMTGGVCSTCHNGRRAMGKPANHIANAAECDTCHTTASFASAGYRHDSTAAGRCDTCHNGQTATGKPSGHLATTAQCDQCHRTTRWSSASFANHDNPRLIGGHAGLDCKVCHPQAFTSVFYRDGVQFGSCSNCHRRNYSPGEHRNVSLQVNANCANCHQHAGYRFND